MAFASARLLFIPLFPSSYSPFRPSATAFPKLPRRHPKIPRLPLAAAAASRNEPPPQFTFKQAFPETVSNLDAIEDSLAAVRTYEGDSARLTLIGAVGLRQAVVAAAAAGGEVADEHLACGLTDMVVETISPCSASDHSTVATKIMLPSRKVKDMATRMKKNMLTKDILRGTREDQILALTFRQVVMEHLKSFELEWFRPGTERSMDNLGNPGEVPVMLSLISSDERVLSAIGEVVCVAAFEDAERHFPHDSTNRGSGGVFSWLNRRVQISSRDDSVVLYNLLENQILPNAKMLIEKFNLERENSELKGAKLKNRLWMSTGFSKLENLGGLEFCAWVSEFVPAYKLEIDSNKFGDVKFEGWKRSDANKWEGVLTHSQMVVLVDNLDMYFEDVFTLPNKRLPCYAVAKPSNLSLNKGNSFLKMVSTVLGSGVFLVAISVLGKLCLPHMPIRKNFIQESTQSSLTEINNVPPHHSVELCELEMCCASIIRIIKDSIGWPGEIMTKPGACAWIGELPKILKEVDATNSSVLNISSTSMPLEANAEEIKALEDIASYQVVVSTEEKSIVGFQPTNRIAVNNWAANPLAKLLHGGKSLSPGLLELGLKMSRPSDVVVLELLISSNPKSYFAMVRAVEVS